MISQEAINEVRALREHDELQQRKREVRERLRDDIADITDKHYEYNAFYRINAASEIIEYVKKNIELFKFINE